MANRKNKVGTIYYDKKDNRYRCIYYVLDKDLLVEKRKTKSFFTEEDAKNFLTTIQCQKGNAIYIKNNGIPLNELLRANVDKKLKTNLIKERTIYKNNKYY